FAAQVRQPTAHIVLSGADCFLPESARQTEQIGLVTISLPGTSFEVAGQLEWAGLHETSSFHGRFGTRQIYEAHGKVDVVGMPRRSVLVRRHRARHGVWDLTESIVSVAPPAHGCPPLL